MKIDKKKRKSKLSAKMLKTLKRIDREIYVPQDNHTERLTKRGYLNFGSPTAKAQKILRDIHQ